MIKKKIFGDLVQIFNGSTPSTKNEKYYNGEIPWLTPKDLSLQNKKYISKGERNITKLGLKAIGNKLLPEETILLSSRAPIGLLSITTNKVSTNQGFKNIVCNKDKILPEYLYYFLKSNIKAIESLGSGTTFQEVSKTTLETLTIFIEENTEIQQKIASVLSALDDKIELNNQINAELEAMAKTLYDYWFVQFDFPTPPTSTTGIVGKPYKSSGGKMVFNKQLKREIPEGWEIIRFDHLIEKTKTGDWGKSESKGNYQERVFCIRGADIDGLNGKENIEAPERYILEKNLNKALQPGDFIIEISGGSPTQSTARIALLTEKAFERFDTNIVCTNFCKAVTLTNKRLIYNFFREWQNLYEADIFFNFEGKTTGIKNFMFDSFTKSYYIIIPPDDLLDKFYDFSRNIEQKKHANLKQNQELASLRDWLLPMLMNGQVSVSDAQEKAEEVIGNVAEPGAEYGR